MTFSPAPKYYRCKLLKPLDLRRAGVMALPPSDSPEFGKEGWPVWVFTEKVGEAHSASSADRPIVRWILLFAVGKAVTMPDTMLKEFVNQIRNQDGTRAVDVTEVPKRIHRNIWEARK